MVQSLPLRNSPCGHLTPTIAGFEAFVPYPAPRILTLSSKSIALLDRASLAVGTLAGVGETLPNPDLLIWPFLKREAVLSSKIEGTQASISDVFIFEASGGRIEAPDTREVVNYVGALNLGLELLHELPICARLSHQVHERLTSGVRGVDKSPGQFRTDQNWIGTLGTDIGEARFVPPPPEMVPDLIKDWEVFVNDDLEMPALVHCALMHYQFETIHPYLDGNGRIGRLLITLFLCAREVLLTPLLYLSAYFEKHRDEYTERLYRVSALGEWEAWVEFFLQGVEEQAKDALIRSRRVRELFRLYTNILQEGRQTGNAFKLLDVLFLNPFVTAPGVSGALEISHQGAQGLIDRFVKMGILRYITGKWPRLYVASDLLRAIEQPDSRVSA